MEIKTELYEWAKETVKDYNKTGMIYYTQSPLDQIKEDNIELLVLGINPGSVSKPFEDCMNDEFWKGKITQEGMTVDTFLQGNPAYPNRDKTWPFWRNFKALLKKADLIHLINDDDSFVYSNIYCGSTKNAYGLPVEKFSMHCKKLIDILKPKRIICFGLVVMDELLKLYDEDRDCNVADLPIRYKKFNNNMKVYGFHHPASRYTTEEKELVGKFLEYYDKNDLPKVDHKNPLPSKELIDLAEKYRKHKAKKNTPEVINLKAQINTQGARQFVWKGSTIVYEFYTDKDPITNEFKKSNNMIVIDLVLLGNNNYEIYVFTRNNSCERTKEIATDIFGSYKPNNDPSRHLYSKDQAKDLKEIVDKMNKLLTIVRSYRDEHFQ